MCFFTNIIENWQNFDKNNIYFSNFANLLEWTQLFAKKIKEEIRTCEK